MTAAYKVSTNKSGVQWKAEAALLYIQQYKKITSEQYIKRLVLIGNILAQTWTIRELEKKEHVARCV